MLELKNVTKIYKTSGITQTALNKVSIKFRDNEFVSILGPSGSGKTTLLNIIGGLDHYTSGDLIISGISTKNYKDSTWDIYRNHKVGFVFQSYNLISHQTALSNVELALTISGVGKKERRKRAIEALKKVGLKDHKDKKPNQMSGGQMQRVAIARALVNDPDILLADEPTGALDSKTSVQIMDLLKEIAKDRLVVMVTHNPDLAKQYSTRIVKLKDGVITDDSNPYDGEEQKVSTNIGKKTSMSFLTALSLSLNNLMTKKARTFLTAFAGSIGIIGIALILSLSNGVAKYIDNKEEEALSNYPLTIQKNTMDMTSMMTSMMESSKEEYNDDLIHSNNILSNLLTSLKTKTNNLKDFKSFLDDNKKIKKYVNDIQYKYDLDINLYTKDVDGNNLRVNPTDISENLGTLSQFMQFSNSNVFVELFNNQKMLLDNYDLLAGNLPSNYNEVVIMVDSNNQISDYTLYALGLKSQNELEDIVSKSEKGEDVKSSIETYSYDDLLGLSYKLVLNTDYYVKENNIWIDKSNNKDYMDELLDSSCDIKVVGIIKAHENTSLNTTGAIGYTQSLTSYVIDKVNASDIVKEQKANPNINIFTLKSFDDDNITIDPSIYSLSESEIKSYMLNFADNKATYEDNLVRLGAIDTSNPDEISIYPKDFNSKDEIVDIIDSYNKGKTETDKITYTDTVGLMMKSVTSIVNIISYVLIAFVGISLVVSSIMIGIITYISVLERKKEIGILRAIGARKKDISRVFNAEAIIEGLSAGVLGIFVTLIISFLANILVSQVLDIQNIMNLPVIAAIVLILISVFLTFIAGLVPATIASKKDLVIALREE